MDVAPRTALINLGLFVLLAGAVLVVNIDDVAANPTTWLVVAAITAAVGLVAIDVFWWINVRVGTPLTPVQAALESLAVGLIFGVAQVITANVFALDLVRGLVLTINSVTISAGAFGVLAILIGQARRAEVARMQDLYEQGTTLAAARSETSGIIRGLHVALASDIDAALSPTRIAIEKRLADQERVISAEDWSDVAGELRMAASGTVRPLSRRLWAYAPARIPSPGLGRILRTIVTEQPFQPTVLILIYWATTFGGTIAALGWVNGLATILIGTVLIACVLGGANTIMRRHRQHHASIFITATITLQLTGLLTFPLRDAWGATPYTWAEYVASCIGGVALILVTSGFGSVRTYRSDLARTFRSDIDDELKESIAASVQVAQLARESARVLHGSVQTRLVACAVAIEQASRTEDVEAFRAAMREAHDALVPPVLGVEDTRGLGEQLERTVSLWSGLCEVQINLDATLRDVRGPLARDICRVVEEAINNAITHGEASQVVVNINAADGAVVVDVVDNGHGPGDDDPGLGSALFDSLCERWKLTAVPHGSHLQARIAK